MGWNRFRRSVLTAMQNAKDPSQVARAIAKAYDTAVKTPQVYSKETASGKRTIEITGDILNKHTVLKGNTSALATYINNQFRLQAFSLGVLPPSLPTLIAQGFPLYWSGATLKPGLPPSLFAPGPILQMMVLNPGIVAPIPYPPAKSTEEFVEHIITLAKMHLFTISGQIIVQVGPTPTPFPWFGYKVVDERVKSSISEKLAGAGAGPFLPQTPISPVPLTTNITTTAAPPPPNTTQPVQTTPPPITTQPPPITTQPPATTGIPQTTQPVTTQGPPGVTPFVIKINVTAGQMFYLPYKSNGIYGGTIDWGDGVSTPNSYANRAHTYANAGQYLITVTGTIDGFCFGDTLTFTGNNEILLDVLQWGSDFKFGTAETTEGKFRGCINLQQISALDTPNFTGANSLAQMFVGCINFVGGPAINNWDVRPVTDMNNMFYSAYLFNSNISAWDTSNVTNMASMFENAYTFNQPIGSWNMSNVASTHLMFRNASAFNQPIGGWNMALVTSIYGMFQNATGFNQPLNNWNLSFVTDMTNLFSGATSFNQPLDNWNVSLVTNMYGMFSNATAFNQPIGNWNVGAVTNMYYMFRNATTFNQPLNTWDVSNVTLMTSMFENDVAFDQDISDWNVINLLDATGFMNGKDYTNYNASYLTAIYTKWSLLAVQPYVTIDFGCIKYLPSGQAGRDVLTNPPNYWTITDCGTSVFRIRINVNAGETFYLPYYEFGVYNGSIDWGDTISVPNTYANRSHTYTSTGTYDISISGVVNGFSFFNYDGTSADKVTEILNWGPGITFGTTGAFGNCTNLTTVSATDALTLSGDECSGMFYNCTNFTGGAYMNTWNTTAVTDMGWMFYEAVSFDSDISAWDTSNVTDMTAMFSDAQTFNQSLSGWDVSSVTTMAAMFYYATSFNQDISMWDTSNVTDMASMFEEAEAFNQPLNSWNVSAVTDMNTMFFNALVFNQDISAWNVGSVTNMAGMFENATTYNQNLSSWNVNNVIYCFRFSVGATNWVLAKPTFTNCTP